VDTSTVTIEAIHTQLATGMSRGRAVIEASKKTAFPILLAMLCVLAVFLPSFFMAGVARQLFVPLSLAVGFAMLASYLLASTLVPVLSARLLRSGHEQEGGWFKKLRSSYREWLETTLRFRWTLIAGYLVVTAVLIAILLPRLGTEIFPKL